MNNYEEDVNSNEIVIKKPPSDILFDTIGNFGKWQFRISLLMALLRLPIAWFQLGNILLAPSAQFYCKKPIQLQNITNESWREFYSNNNNSLNTLDVCHMPNISNISTNYQSCQFGYEYNRTQFQSTIITEWDLVCDRKGLVDLSLFLLMIGILIGNILFGITADLYGRKSSLIFAIAAQSICGIIMSLTPDFWVFTLFRFLGGVANGGTLTISFVLCMEVVGGKYRTIIPILYQIPFGLGSALMALLGYWIRDWRELQLTLSVLSILFLFNFWLCSESPRWLLVTGKKEKAYKLLEEICAINKLPKANIKMATHELILSSDKSDVKSDEKTINFKSIFKSPILLKRTLILYLNWFMNGFTFFAFSLRLGSVGTNPWITVGMGGLAVIPGAILCVCCLQRLGRKVSLISANILGMISFILIQLIPPSLNYLNLLLVLMAVISLSVSLPGLYLYTGELFPTVVRNAGIGSSAMFSRLGSLLSPIIFAFGTMQTGGLLQSEYWSNGPPILLILATLSALQAILICPLPETKDKPLPDTIEEAIYHVIHGKNARGTFEARS